MFPSTTDCVNAPITLDNPSEYRRSYASTAFTESAIDEINAFADEMDAIRAADENPEIEQAHYESYLDRQAREQLATIQRIRSVWQHAYITLEVYRRRNVNCDDAIRKTARMDRIIARLAKELHAAQTKWASIKDVA